MPRAISLPPATSQLVRLHAFDSSPVWGCPRGRARLSERRDWGREQDRRVLDTLGCVLYDEPM